MVAEEGHGSQPGYFGVASFSTCHIACSVCRHPGVQSDVLRVRLPVAHTHDAVPSCHRLCTDVSSTRYILMLLVSDHVGMHAACFWAKLSANVQ